MTLIAGSRRASYLSSSRVVLCDFLFPSFARPVRFTHRLPTTLKVSEARTATPTPEIDPSPSQSPERYACAPKPRSDSSSKRAPLRKPLSEPQSKFLTRAVSFGPIRTPPKNGG
jgi:hypothetical protein